MVSDRDTSERRGLSRSLMGLSKCAGCERMRICPVKIRVHGERTIGVCRRCVGIVLFLAARADGDHPELERLLREADL